MIIHGKFRHPVWVQKAPWCRSESDKKKVTLEKKPFRLYPVEERFNAVMCRLSAGWTELCFLLSWSYVCLSGRTPGAWMSRHVGGPAPLLKCLQPGAEGTTGGRSHIQHLGKKPSVKFLFSSLSLLPPLVLTLLPSGQRRRMDREDCVWSPAKLEVHSNSVWWIKVQIIQKQRGSS